MNSFMYDLEELRKLLNNSPVDAYYYFSESALKDGRTKCHMKDRAEACFNQLHQAKIIKKLQYLSEVYKI